jgi:ketosteroid isomerase-like protein
MKLKWFLLAIFCATGAAIGIAQSPKSPPDAKAPANADVPNPNVAEARAADEAAIRATGKVFMDAYQARDAKKLAALWSPEAVYTDPATGEETVGRDAIEKVFEDAFADKQDAKLSIDVGAIDFVSPNVSLPVPYSELQKPASWPALDTGLRSIPNCSSRTTAPLKGN